MDDVIERLREELKVNADDLTRESGRRFFKEEVALYGVKTAVVTSIANRYLKEALKQPKAGVFALCEALWESGWMEESFVACHWSYALRAQFEPEDFDVLERWVDRYVSNWAACDTLCNHTVGAFVEKFPTYIESLKRWARSPNRWMRRAAAVSLIIPARNGKYIDDVLGIADILLTDKDDLVQKGYGWMLKAAAESHRDEVFAYVLRNRAVMPRTALRYSIEKFPEELRRRAMAR